MPSAANYAKAVGIGWDEGRLGNGVALTAEQCAGEGRTVIPVDRSAAMRNRKCSCWSEALFGNKKVRDEAVPSAYRK